MVDKKKFQILVVLALSGLLLFLAFRVEIGEFLYPYIKNGWGDIIPPPPDTRMWYGEGYYFDGHYYIGESGYDVVPQGFDFSGFASPRSTGFSGIAQQFFLDGMSQPLNEQFFLQQNTILVDSSGIRRYWIQSSMDFFTADIPTSHLEVSMHGCLWELYPTSKLLGIVPNAGFRVTMPFPINMTLITYITNDNRVNVALKLYNIELNGWQPYEQSAVNPTDLEFMATTIHPANQIGNQFIIGTLTGYTPNIFSGNVATLLLIDGQWQLPKLSLLLIEDNMSAEYTDLLAFSLSANTVSFTKSYSQIYTGFNIERGA